MLKSPSEIMDRLCGTFEPMHHQWMAVMPDDSLLWPKTQGKSAADILVDDMNHIGHFFADCDKLGQRSEYALIAECIAHIRLRSSNLPQHAMLEAQLEKALEEVRHFADGHPARLVNETPQFHTPLSWKLAHQLIFEYGKGSPAALDALKVCFHDIADLFLLRDGNLTREEDDQLRIFNAAFGE